MNNTTPRSGYNRPSILIHWILAVSIFFLFLSSWWMLALPLPSEEFRFRELPFQLHKNIGLTLLALIALLIFIRLRHRPGAGANVAKKPWITRLALLDHIALYLLITVVCISGYLSSAHTRWDTTLWWLLQLPRVAEADEDLNMFYSDIHLWSCWLLLAVIATHISGALYHAFRNDGVVQRMLRW